jgi:hypothetical protein
MGMFRILTILCTFGTRAALADELGLSESTVRWLDL